jgi:hypothetical protein
VLARVPRVVAWLAAAWIVAWDVLITEGALWQDYAGITSAEHGDMLFRWGGRGLPFTYSLSHFAVGPLTGIVTELRLVFLVALALLAFYARPHGDSATQRGKSAPGIGRLT